MTMMNKSMIIYNAHYKHSSRDRERERETQTDRQASRETDRQTDRERAQIQIYYTHESFLYAAQGSQFDMQSPL